MGLKAIDGWDYLPPNARVDGLMEQGGWYDSMAGSIFNSSTSSAFGYGNSLSFFGSASNPLQMVYPIGTQTEFWAGARIYAAGPHNAYGSLAFYDMVTGATQFCIAWTGLGVIRAFRGFTVNGISLGTVIQSSGPASFYSNAWFYLEVYGKLGTGSAGAIEVRVNTQPVLIIPNCNTQATGRAAFDAIGIGASHAGGFGGLNSWLIDDLYGLDSSGSVNNTFLGNVRVKNLTTAGAGALTQFSIGGTSPAATNWQSVRNTALTDAQYVYSATPGHRDLYTGTPIISAPMVHGLQVRGAMRQDDATQRSARNVLRTNLGTDIPGQTVYLNQSYTVARDIVEINPDTGVQFTQAEANAVTFGPELVS